MKKWLTLLFYLLLFTLGYLNREIILLWIQDGERTYLIVILLISALIATIPIIPFTIFGGIIGIKYGLGLGLFINWFGGFISALIYYLIARSNLSPYFSKITHHYKKVNQLHSLMENSAFLSILILRLIPIIPPLFIHIYAGISRVPLKIYFTATAIGLIPSMFILAFGGNQLLSNFPQFLIGISLYALFVFFIYLFYRLWSKSKMGLIKE